MKDDIEIDWQTIKKVHKGTDKELNDKIVFKHKAHIDDSIEPFSRSKEEFLEKLNRREFNMTLKVIYSCNYESWGKIKISKGNICLQKDKLVFQ